ncbi:MAG: hypothetical protein K8S27_02325 [Candidatus Omnitrophica bacterium]|nr:hypothetical protein [Candidatus Omnitrophota bacterium]
MITLSFSFAISFFLSLWISIVFVMWILYNDHDSYVLKELLKVVQCPYCTHVFWGMADKELSSCPHCKSYVNLEEPKR